MDLLNTPRRRIVDKAEIGLEKGIENGNATLIMFALSKLAKYFYGDKVTVEHTGTVRSEQITVDLNKLNPEQLRDLAAILGKAKQEEKQGEIEDKE